MAWYHLNCGTVRKAVAGYMTDNLSKDTPYPVFDSIRRICSRALFAVALGCDVLPDDVQNFSPKNAFEIEGEGMEPSKKAKRPMNLNRA